MIHHPYCSVSSGSIRDLSCSTASHCHRDSPMCSAIPCPRCPFRWASALLSQSGVSLASAGGQLATRSLVAHVALVRDPPPSGGGLMSSALGRNSSALGRNSSASDAPRDVTLRPHGEVEKVTAGPPCRGGSTTAMSPELDEPRGKSLVVPSEANGASTRGEL